MAGARYGLFACLRGGIGLKELVEQALCDLAHYFKIRAVPVSTWVSRYDRAMPQYLVGHKELVELIEKRLLSCQGLYLAGNSYLG
ncbi:MAG: hypothetical protein K8F91_06085 [Candidatus Obscuribacterales bacterium]|nr:hypothetical protein [Candidatus Obscuribacterales bacterium]